MKKIYFISLILLLIFFSDIGIIRTYNYQKYEIDYFLEVALGPQYGESSPLIRKWDKDLRIKVNGNPTENDIKYLNQVINELNILLQNKIKINIVETNQNVDMYFVPLSEFSICNAVPGNYGYFTCKWRNNLIYEGNICIATDDIITQEERSHLIREMVTRALGLMNVSNKYPDSIFYKDWSRTQQFSEIDKIVIQTLYSDLISPGMSEEDISKIIYPSQSNPTQSSSNIPSLLIFAIVSLIFVIALVSYFKRNSDMGQNKKSSEQTKKQNIVQEETQIYSKSIEEYKTQIYENIFCPLCNSAIKPQWISCPKCGFDLKKRCPSCEKLVESSWVKCPYCGNELIKKKKSRSKK